MAKGDEVLESRLLEFSLLRFDDRHGVWHYPDEFRKELLCPKQCGRQPNPQNGPIAKTVSKSSQEVSVLRARDAVVGVGLIE